MSEGARVVAAAEPVRPDVVKLGFEDAADASRALSRREVFALWRSDPGFADLFAQTLAGQPFEGLFWETPPTTEATLDAPFECVLVESAAVAALRPDPAAFAAHIGRLKGSTEVVAFDNLGRDAELVVPADPGGGADCAHLAAFLRTAPAEQIRALWAKTAETIEARLARDPAKPVWVSTSGLGVAWVHVRLDSRPKYYTYRDYARAL